MAKKKTRPFSRTIRLSSAQKKILHAMLAYFGPVDPDESITETEIVASWALRGMLDTWRDTLELFDRIQNDASIEITPKMIKLVLKDKAFKHDVDAIDFVLSGMKTNPLFAELLRDLEKAKSEEGPSSAESEQLSKFFRNRKPNPHDEVIVLYCDKDVFS